MVEQVTFQTLFQFLQTVGILVGVFYYIMTIRANQRNQELTLRAQEHASETRQAQLYMTLFDTINNQEIWRLIVEIREYSFTDFDDFIESYGPVKNPDAYAKITKVLWLYTEMGTLVLRGFITLEDVAQLISIQPILAWEKWGPVIERMRAEIWKSKSGYGTFEYLAKAMIKHILDGEGVTGFLEMRAAIPDVEVSDYREFLRKHPEL